MKTLNINEGHNNALLDACKSLRDYSIFVGKVRKYINEEVFSSDNDKRKVIIREAVTQAINECIQENVLKDFFLQYRKEVVEVSVLEYSAERHVQVIGDERYEEGVGYGIELGQDQLNDLYAWLYDLGRDSDVRKATKDAQYRKKLFAEYEKSQKANLIK